VSAQITPALGSRIENLLTWLPAAILILKGLATLSAAIWSPWGSADIFRWSSNYGRDEDLLRLVTPGFGDCLQYIQFVVLTGALTLNYPGYFQPAVSQASWSVLLFNESFVSQEPGTQSLVDGVYRVDGQYGMTKMSQYIGMATPSDIWACMAIWLLVIAVAVVVLCQLGFFGRWIYRQVTNTSEEDLRKKNLPFTIGNLNRLVFNYFILPIVALSLFQLVVAPGAPTSVLACAAVLLVLVIVAAGLILRVIFKTKPRTLLFDDMPTVLLYGPLYNTYNDSAAPFALIPVFITFMRAVAFGAVQPSGIAQIIVLAICEVILILTLNGFRPFQGQTSMNLYHTCFATVRLITVLLMIAFVPSLTISESPKGWIGYVILLLHACVLVFGFFLNSAQTLVEVLARALGAGGDSHSGAIRGSILNWRMLKKRQTRPEAKKRGSTMSTTAMLQDAHLDVMSNGRSRSISASSQQLLGGRISGFDNFSSGGDPLASPDPESENASAFGTMLGGRPSIGSRDHHPGENYYRAPRPRKATLGTLPEPGNKTRSSVAEFPYRDAPGQGQLIPDRDTSYDPNAAHDAPVPAYVRERQGSAGELKTANTPRTDYAVREVDQYYRGTALNDQPTRKLKTGPADPEGPAIVAQSWFQNFLFAIGSRGAKKKEQSKGFEVVRSSRMQPEEIERDAAAAGLRPRDHAEGEHLELQDTPTMRQQPYFDSPTKATGTTTTSLAPDELPQESTTNSSSNAGLTASRKNSGPASEEDGEEEEEVTLGTATRASRHFPSQVFDFGFDGSRPRTSAGGQSPLLNFQPESETLPQQPALIPFRASQIPGVAVTSSDNDRASSHYPDDEDVIHYHPNGGETPPVPPLARHLVAGVDLPPHPLSVPTPQAELPPSHPVLDLTSSTPPPPQPPVRSPKRASVVNRILPGSTSAAGAAPTSATQQSPGATLNPDIADSPSAQAWLAAVDALDRNPHALSRSSTVASRANGAPSPVAATQPPPPPPVPQPQSDIERVGPVPISVHRHRAADSISRNSLGAQVSLQASAAEIFDGGDDDLYDGEQPSSGSRRA
jgi:hypothetical protein